MTKPESIEKQYKKALGRFKEILRAKKTEANRDASILRFEFTFDLCWKFLKSYLEKEKGIKCASPKECFKEAYRQGIIKYSKIWLEMTDWRNEAAHTYNERFAKVFYKKLPKALKHFKELEKVLEK